MKTTEEGSYILASNLEVALRLAIQSREVLEKERGYTRDSIQLAAWKQNLAYLERYQRLEVVL